jgi:hypothetical protein
MKVSLLVANWVACSELNWVELKELSREMNKVESTD